MSSWLFLLAVVTLLVINRRRILRTIQPLNDELYSTKVAIEHVHSGACWVRSEDGKVGFANQSLQDSIAAKPGALIDNDWYQMFPKRERHRVNEAYTQMLLAGIASIETLIERGDGTLRPVNLRLVAVHDRRTQLVGFHCMIHDESRSQSLEQQVRDLAEALSQAGYEIVPAEETQHKTASEF